MLVLWHWDQIYNTNWGLVLKNTSPDEAKQNKLCIRERWRQNGRPCSQNLFLLCVFCLFVSLSSPLYCPSYFHSWFPQSALSCFCSLDIDWHVCSFLVPHDLNLIILKPDNQTNLIPEIISTTTPSNVHMYICNAHLCGFLSYKS